VATAIAKVELTELGRQAVNDAMDVMGGSGLVLGPRNLIAHSYIGAPIAITVEGANILTRTLIIFGQGAIRSHPFALKEVEAADKGDLAGFDHAFWGHVGHVILCAVRAPLLGLTRGWFAAPEAHPLARYRRRLAWASASFALWSEIAMLSLGGSLKRKEKLTGRLADALSWMLLATSVLRRFEAEGRRPEDTVFAASSLDLAFRNIGEALVGVRANLHISFFSWVLRLFPVGGFAEPISDTRDLEIARLMQIPGAQRERIFGSVFLPTDAADPFAQLERALRATHDAHAGREKIQDAIHRGDLHRAPAEAIAAEACATGVITELELEAIRRAEKLREKVIQVDDFDREEFRNSTQHPLGGHRGTA
jgi:acyl-CoA dehydrogenase